MIFHELSFPGGNTWALFVDTSTKYGQLLAFNGTKVLFEKSWGPEAKHDQALNHHFAEISQKLDLKNLSCIICSMGPGSFTGLRVSATFCKILSLSLNKVPIYGVSSFYFHACALLEEDTVQKDSNFNMYISSIGNKLFKSNFKFQIDTNSYTEEIDFSGANERQLSESSDFLITPKTLKASGDQRRLSLFNSKIQPYTQRYTYLDFYPLFLRRSEAEEKVKI